MLTQNVQALQTATVRIGLNLGLFTLLMEAKGPLSVTEVAQKTDAKARLICMLPSGSTTLDDY